LNEFSIELLRYKSNIMYFLGNICVLIKSKITYAGKYIEQDNTFKSLITLS